MSKTLRGLLAAGTAAATVALVFPASAHADEVAGPGIAARDCISTAGATACFESYGDKFYVKDRKKDGYSAYAFWFTNYGRDGACINRRGAGKWKRCNYNMKEGKGIGWYAQTRDGDTGKWGPKSSVRSASI